MEVRCDSRSFLFFLILILLLNSPEPQSGGFNVRSRFEEVIEREYTQLDVLNQTRYGDFNARKDQWLNVTGLRDEDGFAWELLDPVRRRVTEQSGRLLGDRWKGILDGSLPDTEQDIPVYRNFTGYVQGEWSRSSLSRVRHPSEMGNTTFDIDNPSPHLADFDRNLTGTGGSLRLYITELEDKMRRNKNKTVSEISARVVIEDYDSFGGNWWQFVVHGVHYLKSGTAVLTTTSDRFGGIFALPHLQISQHLYSTSQEFLNWTIHETIKRQQNRAFPLWNPWTSSAEGVNEGLFQGYHCEFVLYLQEVPSQYNVDMDWLEHELRYPTGAPIPHHVPFSLSMVGFSPDCGFVIESRGPPPSDAMYLVGSKTEDYNGQARHGIITFAIALGFQLSFLIKQMKETATPSMRSRVSFYTIATLALGDGLTYLILIAFVTYLFLGTSQFALYSVAFIALFSALTHLRFLMDIWSVQAAERDRQDRQQAAAAATNAPPPTNTPTPAPPSIDGGLPLPATAPRNRPPTPIIIAPDQDEPLEDGTTNNGANTATNPRTEAGSVYSRVSLLTIVIFFITIQFATARTMYRSVYFYLISFLYFSFWVPQIYRNVIRNCRKALCWDFVVGTSIVRLVPVAYFYLKEDNILFSKPQWTGFTIIVGWVLFQILALISQEILGPRFFIKEGWAPPAYDYHPILREDEEGATMPLNMTTADTMPSDGLEEPSSSSAETSSLLAKPSAESKTKGKKWFDCSICAQDIEVPVIPAGTDEANVAGMGGTSMILQRRQYMVTPCRHVFHTACLESWMRYALKCPNCRDTLPPL